GTRPGDPGRRGTGVDLRAHDGPRRPARRAARPGAHRAPHDRADGGPTRRGPGTGADERTPHRGLMMITIEGYEDHPLVDGTPFLDDGAFWPAYLAATTEVRDHRFLCES